MDELNKYIYSQYGAIFNRQFCSPNNFWLLFRQSSIAKRCFNIWSVHGTDIQPLGAQRDSFAKWGKGQGKCLWQDLNLVGWCTWTEWKRQSRAETTSKRLGWVPRLLNYSLRLVVLPSVLKLSLSSLYCPSHWGIPPVTCSKGLWRYQKENSLLLQKVYDIKIVRPLEIGWFLILFTKGYSKSWKYFLGEKNIVHFSHTSSGLGVLWQLYRVHLIHFNCFPSPPEGAFVFRMWNPFRDSCCV